MVKFYTLPDDCVQLIFDRLSTQNVLLIRGVCRVWQRHQQLNCRRRKTLVILRSRDAQLNITHSHFDEPFTKHNIDQNGNALNNSAYFEQHRIYISKFNPQSVQFLIKTFPRVDTLFLAHCSGPFRYIKSLICLLKFYSSKLITLKLYLSIYGLKTSDIFKQLIVLLNSFTVLENLTLEGGSSFDPEKNDLQFITRLKQFYCHFYCISKKWFESLNELEQNGELTRMEKIGVGKLFVYRNLPDSWPLARLFTHMPLDYILSEEQFKKLVSSFPSLLTINVFNIHFRSFTKVANLLSSLTKLIHLELHIECPMITDLHDRFSTPQLHSVRSIDLIRGGYACFKVLNEQVETFAYVFPNLQSIKIINQIGGSNDDSNNFIAKDSADFFANLKQTYGRTSLQTEFIMND